MLEDDIQVSAYLDCNNLLWHLTNLFPTVLLEGRDNMSSLEWSDFNHIIDGQGTSATTIAYGLIHPASPTNADVVENSLDYIIDVTLKLGNQFVVHTCDQAIYDIAYGLKVKKTHKYSKLILRLGGFHLALNFMGAIGHIMQGTGLEQVLVEGRVCTTGVVKRIMAGKDYYDILQAYTIVQTAMFQLMWEEFETWLLHQVDVPDLNMISNCIEGILLAVEDNNSDKVIDLVDKPDIQQNLNQILHLLDNFKESICISTTAKLWLMFIEMVDIIV